MKKPLKTQVSGLTIKVDSKGEIVSLFNDRGCRRRARWRKRQRERWQKRCYTVAEVWRMVKTEEHLGCEEGNLSRGMLY